MVVVAGTTHFQIYSNHCWTPGRLAYWSFRCDHKARMEAHQFARWANCMFICDRCMAQRPTKKSQPEMNYYDCSLDAPHTMTEISHTTYTQTEQVVSAWEAMPGWTFKSWFHDPLHTIYLGFAKDLVGSIIADFIDHSMLGGGSLEEQLENFSLEMNQEFRRNKSLAVNFTKWWPLVRDGLYV